MFTIKLYVYNESTLHPEHEFPVRLIQAEGIEIETFDQYGDKPIKHLIATTGRADTFHQESVLIGERPADFDASTKFYDKAYIENETGATTQVVRRFQGSNRK